MTSSSDEFLAVFLIPEPHLEAELLEQAQQQRAVADERLELVAQLHGRRAAPGP